MNTNEDMLDIVELGVASEETQGGSGKVIEFGGLRANPAGISAED